MTYFFIGGAALLAALAAYQYLRGVSQRRLMRGLRWLVGGGAAAIALGLLIARRIDFAVFFAIVAFQVFKTGRLGPFSLEGPTGEEGNVSEVRSRYFAMALDHDTGAVAGKVLVGQFAGYDLMLLGEAETRSLIAEVGSDPDSLSLLESWLDANRSGWREYFAATGSGESPAPQPEDPLADAYAVLGLKPGATDDEIRSAHRDLMKAVHPDHGGSSYLASKINEARDRLLKH